MIVRAKRGPELLESRAKLKTALRFLLYARRQHFVNYGRDPLSNLVCEWSFLFSVFSYI